MSRTTAQPPAQTPYDTEEGEYDDVWPPRLPTSASRYNLPAQQTVTMQRPRKRVVNVYDLPPNIPPRRSRITTQDYVAPALPQGQPAQRRSHAHWLLSVGVGMIAMLTLWVLGTMLVH